MPFDADLPVELLGLVRGDAPKRTRDLAGIAVPIHSRGVWLYYLRDRWRLSLR